jgi:hypothetical protein
MNKQMKERKKRCYQQSSCDLRTLIKHGILVKSKTKGFLHLSDKFIQRRARAMIKISEKNTFNLNTLEGFKDWIHVANYLTVLSIFRRGLREDILGRYSDVIDIFDKPMIKEAKLRLYKKKKKLRYKNGRSKN